MHNQFPLFFQVVLISLFTFHFSSFSISILPFNGLSAVIHLHQLWYICLFHRAVWSNRDFGQHKCRETRSNVVFVAGISAEMWGSGEGCDNRTREATWSDNGAMSMLQFLSLFKKMSWLRWRRLGPSKYFRCYVRGLQWHHPARMMVACIKCFLVCSRIAKPSFRMWILLAVSRTYCRHS